MATQILTDIVIVKGLEIAEPAQMEKYMYCHSLGQGRSGGPIELFPLPDELSFK